MNKLNYPITYAPMRLITVKSSNGGSCFTTTIGYVSAPCYLLKESTIYKGNGTFEKEYEVVFKNIFFEDISKFGIVFPTFNTHGQCTNSCIVKNINNDFNEIKDICNRKSEQFLKYQFDDYKAEAYKIMDNYYNALEKKNKKEKVYTKK